MREIKNMVELKMAQVELKHNIAIKQMQLHSHIKSVKEMLNPITYINLAVSFYKGYHAIKKKITEYRNRQTT